MLTSRSDGVNTWSAVSWDLSVAVVVVLLVLSGGVCVEIVARSGSVSVCYLRVADVWHIRTVVKSAIAHAFSSYLHVRCVGRWMGSCNLYYGWTDLAYTCDCGWWYLSRGLPSA